VPLTLDQSEALCVLRLEGDVDITSAMELKKLLLEGLTPGRDLHLDLERATELDITALQLLWAAKREAEVLGMRFTLVGQVPEKMLVDAGDVGFENFPVAHDPELDQGSTVAGNN
jgi:anti-anti-sigma regulatory factor